ncbi:M6 family metalloprotease domain-containing protein, partial [bacterium]|nr:M6 family metalloprotease domain-containing protein [bacterium]
MNIIAIFIKYPDQGETFKTSEFNDHLFGSHPAAPRSLSDYYEEISYGTFHLTGQTIGWFTAAHDKAYYGANLPNGKDQNYFALAREAVEAADSYINYSDFDSNNDGYVDNVFIIHSGRGEESSGGTADDLWSRRSQLDPAYISGEGTKVMDFTIQPEKLWSEKTTVGIFCHEFGHILGLPDLYDVDYSSNGVGSFCLMGFGSWNTTGNQLSGAVPAHMCVWAKKKLGWMAPSLITSNGKYDLTAAERGASSYMLNNNMPNLEYFLVENRQKVSFDAGLPGNGGVLIWHIDDAKIDDNTDENHKLVDLEQAQATQTLDLDPNDPNASEGSDADYFRQGKSFTDTTNPNSKNYAGASTNIGITDFSVPAGDGKMSFTASFGSTTPTPTYTYTYTPTPTPTSTPQTGLKWKFKTDGMVESSPALGSDGTIYVGSQDGYLYAVNPDGTQKWKFMTFGAIWSSPIVGSDGTIYFGSYDNSVYALNPNGTMKWKYMTFDFVEAKPALSPDGNTLYVGSYDGNFYAFNMNGTLKWSIGAELPIPESARVSQNGTIYIGGIDASLYSINSMGVINWWYDVDGEVYSTPAVSSDNTIYVGCDDYNFYAVNPNGTYRWHFKTGGEVESSPAIANDGTIYVGSFDSNLYSFYSSGALNWKFKTMNVVYSSPAIGNDGTIYVGSDDFNLYAINSDGTLKWTYKTGGKIGSSPAIGGDGTIYVGSDDTYLYAINSGGSQPSKLDFNLHLLPVGSSFHSGDNIQILLDVQFPSNPVICDVYFVMLPPGGKNVFFGFNWNTVMLPILKNITLPTNISIKDAVLLGMTIPSFSPPVGAPGMYTFAFAAAKPGTADFISNIATVNFNVQ